MRILNAYSFSPSHSRFFVLDAAAAEIYFRVLDAALPSSFGGGDAVSSGRVVPQHEQTRNDASAPSCR